MMKLNSNFPAVLLVFLCLISFTHAYWYVTASGCVTCNGDAMRYVKIKLVDEDPLFDDTMATTRANNLGCFSGLTGKGRDLFPPKPDLFIKVEYSYSGTYGQLEVETPTLGINRAGRSSTRSYSRTINFGTLNFDSIHCRSYVRFYNAMVEFKARTTLSLPFKLHIKTDVLLLHGGVPYSTTDEIRIPKNYPVSSITSSLAQHELAHTFRHSYDGSFAHFLVDVVRYGYTRHHSCSTKSNHGFAFNEGWAEFWAGSCYGTYGSSATDYSYEGNVAKALRKLKSDCSASYYRMVNVLRSNRGKIHSFGSYRAYYRALYRC